ncbi:uncharacterized protein DS421_10g307440 [Arachis hypogaea]|nr:uncharacterized protein DS421_10g307440 [Arachis hypogaea]
MFLKYTQIVLIYTRTSSIKCTKLIKTSTLDLDSIHSQCSRINFTVNVKLNHPLSSNNFKV